MDVGTPSEAPHRADPLEKLNAEQRAAVTHGEGPLLVVAGAGTGKTRVIVERIRYLLENHPELEGENILGLTFTEKAAAEMKHRVVRSTGARGEGVWLGTFHRFCRQLLLEKQPELPILDETDHWIVLRRSLPRLELQHYKRVADPGRFLSDFVKFFSRCQDELVTPDDYQKYAEELRRAYELQKDQLDAQSRAEREAEVARQEEVARAYRVSEALLRERRLYTFGALLLETVRALQADPELLRTLRERYRYILVDEFQDTNIAQIELLWLLAGDRRNILAVGDDDQAIYRFRGASFGSFKLFTEKFTGQARRGGVRGGQALATDLAGAGAVKLVQNYRSTKRILRVAGETIAQNADRVFRDKRLVTANPEGEKIRIVEFGSPEEEARWIAEEIAQGHRQGHPWSEFAVLYRAHLHRDKLVEALVERGIPFVIKNLSILDHPLVRDVIAYLRLIDAPADNVACARALAAPAWGVEPAGLVRLAERASKGRGRALWDALAEAQGELSFTEKNKRTAELVLWINSLRARAKSLAVSELLKLLLDEMLAGLELAQLPADAERRALDRFKGFVAEWETKSETKRLPALAGLREFVEYLAYFREAGGQVCLEEELAEEAVQLMTVHAAKGLEFDQVFLMRLLRGAFPVWRRRPVLEFPEKLMKEALPEGDYHIQEERRLFYVALTRARKRLTLSTIINQRAKPSLFLDDILLDPQTQKRDVAQFAPKVAFPSGESRGPAAARQLFPLASLETRAYSQIARWAAQYHPPVFEPLQLSASGHVSSLPATLPLPVRLGVARRAAGGHDVRQRDAHDNQTIRGRAAQETAPLVRRSRGDLLPRVVRSGFPGRIPGARISKSGPGTIRSLL